MAKKAVKSVRYSIKRPMGHRRTFGVMKDTIFLNRERLQEVVEDSRLDALNNNLRMGVIDADAAYMELKGTLIPTLKKETGQKLREEMIDQVSENNRKVFLAFWQDKYKDGDLKHEASTRNDLLATLRAIDPHSITTATKDELRTVLAPLPPHQQRRYVVRVNQLLEFLGRGFSLTKKPRDSLEVGYITWDELQEILPHIFSEEVRHLAVALYGTGVRIGEAFAPGFTRLKPNGTIFIGKQMRVTGDISDPKNGKPHHTVLLPEAKESYKAWCAVPGERKAELRQAAIKQIIAASKKAFPRDKSKQISAHDLRHSYAIHWLGLGASLSQIANALGDTIATVQLHYTGYVMTDEQVEGMRKLL
jgi:integrase